MRIKTQLAPFAAELDGSTEQCSASVEGLTTSLCLLSFYTISRLCHDAWDYKFGWGRGRQGEGYDTKKLTSWRRVKSIRRKQEAVNGKTRRGNMNIEFF